MAIVACCAAVFAGSAEHRRVPNHMAAGIAADRVNTLLLIAASDEPRAATEALMLVSIRPSSGDVAVLSVPNDLWVRMGSFGTRRLGSAGAVGSTSGYPGRGPGLVRDTVETVLGQPIHGFVRLTPEHVEDLVDAVGGVTVEAERGAYETKTRERFPRGRLRLTGMQATRFALSRRMAGTANDRFPREARQRAVVAALLAKRPDRFSLGTALSSGVVTNLSAEQLLWLRDRAMGRSVRTVTLAPHVEVFEVATAVDQGEALRPRDGTFERFQAIAANVFAVQ